MRIALFYHSLQSCWNNGHAHFLRGYATSLQTRGHEILIYEPRGNWSLENLVRDGGTSALSAFAARYPQLSSTLYDPGSLDLDRLLDGVDLVIAHEWNDPSLIGALGAHRRTRMGGGGRYALLFHDTHHRAATAPEEMARFDLSAFDGALVYGEVLREIYTRRGWAQRAWVWHEAADTRIFRPLDGQGSADASSVGDLVWIGNWGDEERSRELHEFLIEPVRMLGLRAAIHGVRYPDAALRALKCAGIEYRGWLANALAPEVFARHRVTVHIPRRPYTEALPGIPTIRVFEALACGIPLISSSWNDAEGLFSPGRDFLIARNGAEMTAMLRDLLDDPGEARAMARRGLETLAARHTTDHRADELLAICRQLGIPGAATTGRPRPHDLPVMRAATEVPA